jgi:hypothetical protein
MTPARARLLLVTAVLMVPTLLLAGCGGQDVDTTTATDSVPELPDAADDVGDVGDTADAAPDLELVGDECAEALEAFASAQAAHGAALAGGNMDFAEVERELQALTDAAPSEIRPAFQAYTDELGGYLRELDAIGLDPGDTPTPEQLQRLSALAESLDQDALQEAAEEIAEFFEERCG